MTYSGKTIIRTSIVALLFAMANYGYSQSYRNLVFEGAGIRGLAYVGALEELDQRGVLQGIEKVGGTSAGAIAALTVALRYSPQEIHQIIYNTKLHKFNDGKFFFIGGFVRMNRNYGWYRGNSFEKWLQKIITDKTGNGNITFRELHDRGFRDLYITGTSLNNQRLIVFSYENYPDMKVKDAVRISMSIPFYFEAVRIDSSGNVLNRKDTGLCDVMVDGGLTGNFPIFIFDTLTSKDPEKYMANPYTLGLRIDTNEQIKYDQQQKGLAPVEVNNLKSYIGAFYNYAIENLNRYALTDADWKRTVSISSGGIGPKIKRLSSEQSDLLINNGRIAVKHFFE